MRVAVDYTAAVWQGGGIGRYTRELIGAAAAQGGVEYRLFYAARGLPGGSPFVAALRRLCTEHRHVRATPIPLSPRDLARLWHRLRLPLRAELFTGPVDLLHAPDFALPPTRSRAIVTVHDLAFLLFPQFFTPPLAAYLRRVVSRAVRRADLLLADSEATRRDLEQLLGVAPARVAVVYPGVSPAFRPLPPEACAPLRERLGLPERFILFVSTISPRKNLVRLLEAFAALDEGCRTIGEGLRHPADSRALREDGPVAGLDSPPLSLVIAGQKGWLYDEVFAAIARLGLRERVRVLDFVDDNDLPALYNLAWASVYPSLYEGFGLPALEALACGTPLLTADNSSLPEAVGAAALLVDAADIGALTAGLRRICTDEALRAQLREAGPAWARQFTWERAAHSLLGQYRRLYTG